MAKAKVATAVAEVEAVQTEEVVEVVEKKNLKVEFIDNPVISKLRDRLNKYTKNIPEMMKTYREFTIGSVPSDRTLRVYFPSPGDEAAISQTQSKAWGRLIKDEDLQTEEEIINSLKKREIWDDMKDKRIESLQTQISAISNKLYKAISANDYSEHVLNLTEEYKKLDEELDGLLTRRNTYVSNSLESRVNDIRIREQLWRCVKEVKNEDGVEKLSLLWDSFSAVENEVDRVLLITVMTECITFWQGVPSNFLEEWQDKKTGEADTP